MTNDGFEYKGMQKTSNIGWVSNRVGASREDIVEWAKRMREAGWKVRIFRRPKTLDWKRVKL